MSQVDLISVGTLIIGLWVAVNAIFAIVNHELAAFLIRDSLDNMSGDRFSLDHERRMAQMTAARIANVVELLMGFFLIAGRASIARFLIGLRRAGT